MRRLICIFNAHNMRRMKTYIHQHVNKDMLKKETAGGKSTNYELK